MEIEPADRAREQALEPAPAVSRPVADRPRNGLLGVQTAAGNQAVNALLGAVQPKLVVGAAGDRHEQEADAIARQVAGALGGGSALPAAAGQIQRHSASVGDEGGPVDAATESMLTAARQGGRPMPEAVRRPMETAFGADFESVRLHTGSRASALNDRIGARAFTLGSDIFFRGRAPESSSRADTELLAHELTHTLQQTSTVQRKKKDKLSYDEVDGRQYRVFNSGGERKIQQVMRRVDDDGAVVYEAIGEVTGFDKNAKPILDAYDDPVPLFGPDGKTPWYPAVTHVNGMAVKPESGINSASELKDHIDDALKKAGEDVALGQDGIDVLFSYSATRGGGNFVADLGDCIKGKRGIRDTATENQENIMLDAVRQRHRTTVSAHSRGTIKTDNAVRNVHKTLSRVDFRKEAEEQLLGDSGEKPKASAVKKEAERIAAEAMNNYIQLIYAGNAVTFPSKVLKIEMFARKGDFVSLSVGSYTGRGARLFGAPKGTTMEGGSGGHGFGQNYSESVGKAIGTDIANR